MKDKHCLSCGIQASIKLLQYNYRAIAPSNIRWVTLNSSFIVDWPSDLMVLWLMRKERTYLAPPSGTGAVLHLTKAKSNSTNSVRAPFFVVVFLGCGSQHSTFERAWTASVGVRKESACLHPRKHQVRAKHVNDTVYFISFFVIEHPLHFTQVHCDIRNTRKDSWALPGVHANWHTSKWSR